MLRRTATDGYKVKPKFHRVGKGIGFAHSTILIRLPVQTRAPQDDNQRSLEEYCESLWMKMIGKPYLGKLNVRFDEGVLEIGYG